MLQWKCEEDRTDVFIRCAIKGVLLLNQCENDKIQWINAIYIFGTQWIGDMSIKEVDATRIEHGTHHIDWV